ncbi:MAG: glycosyltransferase [candidate division KSB1 bacterium]|jgi:chlorobactene glucosyltransferase|nr:glycosyltransferase [candidate division KSB1 bacterium]
MIAVLLFALMTLALILMVTVFNVFTAPMINGRKKPDSHPSVSILVPARNEENNIAECLDGLLSQDYPNFNITVLDDHSEDDTAAIVKKYVQENDRVQYIQGEQLPQEWTGKNWACHQLGRKASGEILVFTDADNRHAPYALSNTVAYMEQYHLGMISAFPEQETVTLAEKLIVPIMDLFVYGTLPLWATYYSSHASLAAANGQWICFTRKAYETLGGHETVKMELVEDTQLSRIAKKRGIRTLTVAGTGAVYCRMYQNVNEVWEGFSKNFYGLTGYNPFVFTLIISIMLAGFVSPYLLWIVPGLTKLALVGVGMNVLIRLLISAKYKHPILTSVVLHPVGVLFAVFIGFNSMLSIKRGRIQWKGRVISLR